MNRIKNITFVAAVSGVLGGASLFDSNAVQADALMFPYVVNSATISTVVSIINTSYDLYNASGVAGKGGSFNRLHWRLHNKNGNDATNNTAACGEVNAYLPTSRFDIQTVDLGGHFGATNSGVLFNDPSINNDWQANLGGLSYALASSVASPSRGVLIVDNADTDYFRPPLALAASIAGEAFIYEFGSGAAWGYQGAVVINDTGDGDNGVFEMDFGNPSLGGATPGGALSFVTSTPIFPGGITAFMPPEEIITRFFVTPLNRVANTDCDGDGLSDADIYAGATIAPSSNCSGAAGDPGEARYNVDAGINDTMIASNYGNYRIQLQMVTIAGVAYDRDENLVSGSTPAVVRCVGGVSITELFSSYSPSHALSNGGWGYVQARLPAVDTATYGSQDTSSVTGRASVYKLEFNAGSTFNGATVGGVFNNAVFMP